MSIAFELTGVLLGLAAALEGLYLMGITAAAAAYRQRLADAQPRSRLLVLVPAHNEESLIGRCLASIRMQSYPHDMFRVVVVADNCDDNTAVIAAAGGAEVFVRDDPLASGKGHALRWAIDRIAAAGHRPTAVVFIDADSVADPSLLSALEAESRCGADAVQADYYVLNADDDPVRSAALLLFNRVRSQGRQALRLPAQLLGNGMLVSFRTLEQAPWHAFSPVEDLEYSIDLCIAGYKVSFTPAGRVLGPLPPSRAAATTQRLRWEGGRLYVLGKNWRRLLSAVLRKRDLALAETLYSLVVPPITVLALAVALGAGASSVLAMESRVPWWVAVPWIVAASTMAGHVLWGLRIGNADVRMYLGLCRAPLFVAWKLIVYTRLAFGGFDPTRWDRTARTGELESELR